MKRRQFPRPALALTLLALLAPPVLLAVLFVEPLAAQMPRVDPPEVSEALLALEVKSRLIDKLGADALAVNVEVLRDKVVLTGEVQERATEELAKEIALSVPQVNQVDDRLSQNPRREPGAVKDFELELKDALLETRVKNVLITDIGKNALKIEVESTDGAVSLRGTVPAAAARAAVTRTRTIHGVKRVIDLLRTS